MASRYLESLERWLGVRLLNRTTRRVSLTDAGAEALERCRSVLSLTEDVRAVAGIRREAPAGSLRITSSTSFAQAHLTGAITDFLARYPQIRIELITMERAVNLVEERIDLAVRIGNQIDETLVARSLGVCRSVVCASPAYLAVHGTPLTPEDLRKHRCITHAHVGRTEFRMQRDGHTVRVPVSGPLQSNATEVTCRAALDGAGIALLPTYFASDTLVRGELVRVLPDYEPEPLGIHAVYLSRQYQPRPVRLMLDFLAERFSGEVASWDLAIANAAPRAPAAPIRRRGVSRARS
jgi:DNA-binding transcriptional LysR family regulator